MKSFEHAGRRVLLVLLCMGMAAPAMADDAPGAPAPVMKAMPASQDVATVNGKSITIPQFNARYNAIMRERFFHGKTPEGGEAAVRKEVLDLLIEDELLVEEAGRRGFRPDEAKLKQAAAAMEARYSASPEWQKNREWVLSAVKEQAGRQDLIEQARKALHEVPPPTPDEVRAYYERNPALFTEPEKLRMSVILLKVEPGTARADLEKTFREAQGIYQRLKDGADFAELARQYSGDSSADKGGDYGYVHGGMLPEKLQKEMDKAQVGVVAEPLRVLEGVAIYRLNERVPAVLRGFAEVEQRAQELLQRDRKDRAWKEAIGRLTSDAKIEIIVPLDGGVSKQGDASKQGDSSKPSDSSKQGDASKPSDTGKPSGPAKKRRPAKK